MRVKPRNPNRTGIAVLFGDHSGSVVFGADLGDIYPGIDGIAPVTRILNRRVVSGRQS